MIILHFFVWLLTLGLQKFEQQVCSTKIGSTNALVINSIEKIIGEKELQKMERGHFELRTLSKKAVPFWQRLIGTTTGRFIQLLLIFLNLEICLALEQNSKKVHSRTTTKQPEHGFVDKMDKWLSTGLVSKSKKWWWSPFAWIIDVALQNAWCCIALTKMKAMSPYLS